MYLVRGRTLTSASMDGAQFHVKGFVSSTIGAHPQWAALAMAAMLVLIIVLLWRGRQQGLADGYLVNPQPGEFSNLKYAGNNPLWQNGSMDAGQGGPVTRGMTTYNMQSLDQPMAQGRRVIYKGGLPGIPGVPNVVALSPQRGGGGLRQDYTECAPGTAENVADPQVCLPNSVASAQCAYNAAGWDTEAVLQAEALRDNLASGYQPVLAGTDVNMQRILAGDGNAINVTEATYLTSGDNGF